MATNDDDDGQLPLTPIVQVGADCDDDLLNSDEEKQEDELPPLNMIWECKKIMKVGTKGTEGEGCVCAWCGVTFMKGNATKVFSHLMKIARTHAKACTG
jgi:hypothetical protein